jgi:hypothetical protein
MKVGDLLRLLGQQRLDDEVLLMVGDRVTRMDQLLTHQKNCAVLLLGNVDQSLGDAVRSTRPRFRVITDMRVRRHHCPLCRRNGFRP